VERLKVRRDFVSAAGGRKVSKRAFTLQARRRGDTLPARIGFTVTKRTAKKAVERNRIRRRLKEAVRLTAERLVRPGVDYVLIGRRAALTIPFTELTSELSAALTELGARLAHGMPAEQGAPSAARRPADG
jgi:ribonuclease P protein component